MWRARERGTAELRNDVGREFVRQFARAGFIEIAE